MANCCRQRDSAVELTSKGSDSKSIAPEPMLDKPHILKMAGLKFPLDPQKLRL